jgi:hypothetical protein
MMLPDQVLAVMSEASRPLTAREIVDLLAKRGVTGVDKSGVNHCLYGPLKAHVHRDDRFRWSIVRPPTSPLEPPCQEPKPSIPNFGLNYPVADYYRDRIQDGVTLSRGGQWWSAALLIEDPRTEETFVGLYLWEMVGGVWKKRKSFVIRSRKSSQALRDALVSFEQHLA